MARKKKRARTRHEVVRKCFFCGFVGNPHTAEPAWEHEDGAVWLISYCHSDLPAICPTCVAAGRNIGEITDERDRRTEL